MRGRMITAASIVLVGAIWIGQGSGLLRGSSFMVDDTRWTITGVVAVAFGLALALSAWRSGPREG